MQAHGQRFDLNIAFVNRTMNVNAPLSEVKCVIVEVRFFVNRSPYGKLF